MHILLVDDEPDSLEMLRHTLERGGHVVTTASDGKIALDVYDDSFDAILCDIIMPEMDGLEFIQALLKRNPKAKIIAYTGGSRFLGKEDTLAVAKSLGAYRTFSKDDILDGILPELKLLGNGNLAPS